MPRRSSVTFTAAAVTLACLGASLYASPQVIAEHMGRQVQAFSPLDPTTYPGTAEEQTPQLKTTADASREQSTLSGDGTWTAPVPETTSARTQQVEHHEFKTADTESRQSSKLPEEPVADDAAPSPLSQVEVALPAPDTGQDPDDADDPDQSDEETVDVSEDVDSPDALTVIVNKARPLPEDFVPADLVELPTELGVGTQRLRQEAADATESLLAAAEADDVALTVVSSYRSFEYQQDLYNNYLHQYGTAVTDEMSARPGFSEHQTGLAIDVSSPAGDHTLQQSFGDTEAGRWLADSAHKYGFVVRYPQDQQDITGFEYEPWHLRYFGEEHAQRIVENTGVAELEFGLDPAPDYTE